MEQSNFCYGVWRTDKPREEGFSHELISPDAKYILDKCDLDTLDALKFPEVDSLYKAVYRNVKRIGNNPWLGTRVGDEY